MLPPIPSLEAYGISPQYGFLPSELPLSRLPDPYYNKWENIVSNLQGYILSKRLRGVIDQLPVLSTSRLVHVSEWRRAYSILCFLAHSYIWGDDKPSERLPASISIPLLHVSDYLEVPPVATYAAVCLWNFKSLFTDEGIDNLDNLATLTTFTGSTDESWFYLVSLAIEARGAPSISLMLRALNAIKIDEKETIICCLQIFAEILEDLGKLLEKMHDGCDPHIFYHRIRPFLAGSKNMAEAGLTNGLIYEDGTGSEEFRQYSGGSNAQSSLFQFFDIILGVQHLPTGEKRDQFISRDVQSMVSSPSQNFILEMREYMPGPHRRFLEDIEKVSNLREYVFANQSDDGLTLAYDACLKMLSDFRSRHINIVSRYIILKSRQKVPVPSLIDSDIHSDVQCRKKDISTSSLQHSDNSSAKENLKGTGGTALIPFLKQARDETSASAANAWARRIMNRVSNGEYCFLGNFDQHLSIEIDFGKLGADWAVGGLCHY